MIRNSIPRDLCIIIILHKFDYINLLCIGSQTGPDTGQTGQGRLSGLPDHQGVGVARLCQVGQEGGGVEPDEVEPGQRMLVPDQRSVDVVNAGHQVDPWMTDQAGDGSLGLAIPQHRSVNVVNNQIKMFTILPL